MAGTEGASSRASLDIRAGISSPFGVIGFWLPEARSTSSVTMLLSKPRADESHFLLWCICIPCRYVLKIKGDPGVWEEQGNSKPVMLRLIYG